MATARKVTVTCATTGAILGNCAQGTLSTEIATPAEAREVLRLKGGDNVGF